MSKHIWLALAMVCLAGLTFAAPGRQRGSLSSVPGQAEFVKKALAEAVGPKREPNPEWVQQVRSAENLAFIPPQYRALIQANTQGYMTVEEYNALPEVSKEAKFRDNIPSDALLPYAGKNFCVVIVEGKLVFAPLRLQPEMMAAVFEPPAKIPERFKLSKELQRSLNAEEKAYAKVLLEVLNENYAYLLDVPNFVLEPERFARNEYAWKVIPKKSLLVSITPATWDDSTSTPEAFFRAHWNLTPDDPLMLELPKALLHPTKGEIQQRLGVPVYDWSAILAEIGPIVPCYPPFNRESTNLKDKASFRVETRNHYLFKFPFLCTMPDNPWSGVAYVVPCEPQLAEESRREFIRGYLHNWNDSESWGTRLFREEKYLENTNQLTPNKQEILQECYEILRQLHQSYQHEVGEILQEKDFNFYTVANPNGKPKQVRPRSCLLPPPSTAGNVLKRSPQPIYKKR